MMNTMIVMTSINDIIGVLELLLLIASPFLVYLIGVFFFEVVVVGIAVDSNFRIGLLAAIIAFALFYTITPENWGWLTGLCAALICIVFTYIYERDYAPLGEGKDWHIEFGTMYDKKVKENIEKLYLGKKPLYSSYIERIEHCKKQKKCYWNMGMPIDYTSLNNIDYLKSLYQIARQKEEDLNLSKKVLEESRFSSKKLSNNWTNKEKEFINNISISNKKIKSIQKKYETDIFYEYMSFKEHQEYNECFTIIFNSLVELQLILWKLYGVNEDGTDRKPLDIESMNLTPFIVPETGEVLDYFPYPEMDKEFLERHKNEVI